MGSFLYEWRELILLAVLAWFVLSYTPAWLSSSSNVLCILAITIPLLICVIVFHFTSLPRKDWTMNFSSTLEI